MSNVELQRFFKGRKKNPTLYDYDEKGDLVEKNKEGAVIKTIALPQYRSLTMEEFDEMEKKRKEAIAIASKKLTEARKALRQETLNPNANKSTILQQNQNVVKADIELQKVRFPLQYVSKEKGLKMYMIDVEEPDVEKPEERRVYPYSVAILKTNPFFLQEQYVRIGKAPEKPLLSLAEIKANQQVNQRQPVILFSEPDTNDYGFLSLSWVVELEINGTMYHSAKQAIYAEIAKAFQDKTNLEKIMLAESPDTIHYSIKNIPGDTDNNEIKWNDLMKRLLYDVTMRKFKQYPALATRLLETQQAILGAYEPTDILIGIGISMDSVQAQNPIHWTGQNLLGKALMDVRNQLREEQQRAEMAPAPASAPVPSVKQRPKTSLKVSAKSKEPRLIRQIPTSYPPPPSNQN